ncbi:hypothetical protein [Curtobacterium sp. VKM Ac-2884]|uniref:hypothetical protein n=1 Tax=Curtobacterium sp. VKM Ac-2884 TaxID=2783818 RepID=UPI00188BD2B1|nr:hypothetical protein [Curtobacterium sp. VKM Ac-2884]MBF4603778.1 hypothetical protein [Curtobacterium sp. VKM Ac-2884]
MTETQILAYRLPREKLVDETPVHAQNFALNEPSIINKIGPGWSPVHHTITLLGDEEILVTFLLTREPVAAPAEIPYDLLDS